MITWYKPLKNNVITNNMEFGYIWLTSPQIRHKCAHHAYIATLGRIWPHLAMAGHILSKVLTDVHSIVEHGHNWSWLVMSKASPEWTNSDHVQPSHLKTCNQARPTMGGGLKQGCSYHTFAPTLSHICIFTYRITHYNFRPSFTSFIIWFTLNTLQIHHSLYMWLVYCE